MLGLARSSYYHRSRPSDERALREAIVDIASRFPRYGSRKIMEQLKRAPYGIVVGRHRVRRLMREMNLLVKPKRRRSTTTADTVFADFRIWYGVSKRAGPIRSG